MLRIKGTFVVLLALSFCWFGCSGDNDDEDISDGSHDQSESGDVTEPDVVSACEGVWTITSAVLDEIPYDTYGAVWTIGAAEWALDTAICSSTGTTGIEGENIAMTVSTQNCADPIPAPEGRTASGTCSVEDGVMTMTLSHDLEGTVHLLTVTGQQ